MDEIYGVTMQLLAETFSKDGELRAKLGEQQGRVEFEQYLRTRGIDMNTWALAWNAWHDRFKADPTGRLEAQFHMMLSELTAKAHFGDVRDMSGDTEEGITLDQYAQITVAVSRAGADIDQIVRQFGLQDGAHWQRANAAWAKKMGEDTSHKLSMQYGQLYSKYAGSSFAQEKLDAVAATLAEANKPRDRVDEPQEELTPDLCLRKMQSPSQNERWKYAYHYAHMADLGNVPDKNQAIMNVAPILLEMIERHDDHQTSEAYRGARKLWDLGVRGDDFRGAVARCLARSEEKLRSLEAAFAPIQNQAVPERIILQQGIQDHRNLIDYLRELMNENWAVAQQASMAPMPMGSMAPMAMAPPKKGGFPLGLLALPLVVVIGGGVFYMTKGRAMLAARSAAASASESASASASAAPTTTPSAKPTSAPAATQTAAATATAPAKAKKKKGK
jgi:hypothetical protein